MINKLGFGFLRLPKIREELDWEDINKMVDVFMDGGILLRKELYDRHNAIRFDMKQNTILQSMTDRTVFLIRE